MNGRKCVVQKETHNENGDKIYLCYFITCSGNNCYGVEIDMYTQYANRRTEKERKCINNIFTEKREAMLFINAIAEGLVTPLTLSDIIEDKNFEKLEKNTCICKESVIY